MTQYVINIGTIPNDGTGDPLRTAFNEVNLNFNQIWATGLVGSNITVANNTILTSNTNGNLILNPNGIGVVQANAHIVPDQTRVRNLGSNTLRWNTVYSQYLNIAGDASITGNLSVTGNIVYIGNLVTDAKTIQLANTAGTANAANGSGITVGANDDIATLLFDSTSNTWTTNIGFSTGNLILVDDRIMDLYGPSITNADLVSGATSGLDLVPNGNTSATTLFNTYGNIQLYTSNTGANVKTFTFDYTGNLTLPSNSANINYANGVSILNGVGSNYGNSNVATFLASFGSNTITTTGNITAGNIVPGTSNVYSLGNSTHQWSDLYVSNATIYMNNVPISLTAGNILTVNGNDVVTTNANGQTTLGNLSVDDNNIYNTNGQGVVISNFSFIAEAETAYVQIPAGNSTSNLNVVQEQGNVRIAANAAAWLFDTNSTLTVPGDITSDGTFAINSGDDISISGGNQPANSAVSEGGDVTIFGGTGRLDNGISTGSGGDIRINAGNGGDGVSSGAGPGGYAEVQGGSGGSANVVNNIQAGEGGYVVIQGGQGGDNAGNIALSGLGGNVEIYGGTGSADDGNSTISGAPGHVNLYGGNWGFAGLATGNIYLNTYDGTNFKTLTYDSAGNVTMAPGGGLNFVGSNPGITSGLNQDFYIRGSDNEEDGWAIFNVIDDGAGNQLTKTQLQYNRFSVYTDVSGNNYSFDFRDTGEFDVPKSIRGPFGGNLVISIGDQFGSDTFIDLQTRSYVGDALISNVRIANPNVTVSTASEAYNWTFDGTGNLVLPPSGNLVGATANNSGRIQWLGNSSGDGAGYTTLGLVPDDTLTGSDQYLIIDPTAPGHIHIRAGGTQDNSNADLFLGGENTYFKVNAGANSEARISANSHSWVFGQDATLTVPGEGIIRSVQDTVILQSYDVYGNTYSARLGTNGGLYFETSDYPTGWLSLTNNSGNANITAATGTSGGAGKNIYIIAGAADQTDYYTTAGGDINILGGLGAFNDGGGGGPGGNINLKTGDSADPAGHAGNINITAGTNNWVFDYTGNTTFANGTVTVGNISATGAVIGERLVSTLSVGNEGGQVNLSLPAANTTLTTSITLDSFRDRFRVFETGGTNRGMYIDLDTSPAGGAAIGYRDIPQVTFSANATAALNDAGKHYYSTTAGNLALTLPDNSSVAFPTGATLTIVVNAAGNVLVNQGSGVSLYQAGSSSTGNRVVGAYGLATVMKVAANTWVISGTGVY